MGVQADKKPPVNKVNREYIEDFSGGQNTTINGSLLNKNEAQIADDISFSQKGTITPRKGRYKRYDVPFSADPTSGIAGYYKNDGTSRLVIGSGTYVFYDEPHMETKWTLMSDWTQAGTSSLGKLSYTEVDGSITASKQLLGDAARCEDAALWSSLDVTDALSTDTHYTGGKSIEVTLAAGKTVGYDYLPVTGLTTTKYAVLSAYVKKGTATSIGVVARKADGSVVKASAVTTNTYWTKLTLKLSPADVALVTSVGVVINGAAGQTAKFTGLYLHYITETDYNNAGYVAPDITTYEPYDRAYVYDTDAEWDAGTHSSTDAVSNKLRLAIEKASTYFLTTTQAEFSAGTLTNVSATELANSVVLARQA